MLTVASGVRRGPCAWVGGEGSDRACGGTRVRGRWPGEPKAPQVIIRQPQSSRSLQRTKGFPCIDSSGLTHASAPVKLPEEEGGGSRSFVAPVHCPLGQRSGREAMILQRVIRLLAACVRRLQLRDEAPSCVRKFALSVASLPLLSALLLVVCIHKTLRGPLRIESRARFGARFSCWLPSFVQNRICLFGVWEPDITAFVSRRLVVGDTFVDVGANVGYYTLLASQLVGESGRVVAVEISPSILKLLEANLDLAGGPPNVRTVHAAAAAVRGTLTVFRAPDWRLNLTGTLPRPGLSPEAQVEAAPLDDLLTTGELATTRLIKINVEGTELDVLAGIQRLVVHGRRDLEILVELIPEHWPKGTGSPEEALRPLFDAGFHAYRIDNNYMPWRYLWPEAVRPPRRVRTRIKPALSGFGCVDLVLSRVDAETL